VGLWYTEVMSKELGERIRGQRLKLALSQAALSVRARDYAEGRSINVETLSRIETGRNEPAAWMVQALARALETTTDYILGLTPTPDLPAGAPKGYPAPAPELAALVARLNRLSADQRTQIGAIIESILEFGTGSHGSAGARSPSTAKWEEALSRIPPGLREGFVNQFLGWFQDWLRENVGSWAEAGERETATLAEDPRAEGRTP
jgi:transcriptional regulator with XRE-family HTH domain